MFTERHFDRPECARHRYKGLKGIAPRNGDEVMPASLGVAAAQALGAETAIKIGAPGMAAFCAIST